MIDFFRQLPAWLWAHPWTFAGCVILGLAFFTSLISVNPNGRQLREKLRRRR